MRKQNAPIYRLSHSKAPKYSYKAVSSQTNLWVTAVAHNVRLIIVSSNGKDNDPFTNNSYLILFLIFLFIPLSLLYLYLKF